MASKSFKFTETAKEDLDEILDYISNTLENPIAALDFYNSLNSRIDEITLFPESCEKVDNPNLKLSGVRKALIKSFIAYYYYDKGNDEVIILALTYAKRNLDEILKILPTT